MSMLSWADNRTLLGCQLILCVLYGAVFLLARRLHPHLRGTECYSLGFFSVLIGNILLMLRGVAPYFVSVVVANLFQFSACAFLYIGTLRFLRSPRSSAPAWIIVAVSIVAMTWFTVVNDRIVIRIVIIGCTVFTLRLMLAAELLRHSSGRPFLKLFGAFSFFTGLFSVSRGVLTMLNGAPANYMQRDTIQTGTLVVNLIIIFSFGLFMTLLVGHGFLARMELQSQQDSVSGLLNRRGIEQRLAIELNRVKRKQQKLSVALIDLDHFKRINDTAGHAAGDMALRKVAEAVSGQLRGYDSLGRFGGDEFLLLLPQTDARDATLVADRFAQAVQRLALDLQITLSIGITEALADDALPELLLRADQALYSAKDAGRNCIRAVLASAEAPLSVPSGTAKPRPHLVA